MDFAYSFYNDFKPELTPKQMLEYGVFGGSYLGETIKEYPESWFKKAKLSKSFDVNLNFFKIRSGLSLIAWRKKGWIMQKIQEAGFNGTVVFQSAGVY